MATLALAILATFMILTQPIPPRHLRTEGMLVWVALNMIISITTIWLFYAKLPA